MIRVLYLNAKSDDTDRVASEVAAVSAFLGKSIPKLAVASGFDDFTKNAKIDGGWNGWTRRIVPRFDLFVLPALSCGKATYDIVLGAFAAGKRVIHIPIDADLVCGPPKNVLTVEAESDRRKGYRVVLAG